MLSPFGGAVLTMRIIDDAEGTLETARIRGAASCHEAKWSEQWKRKEVERRGKECIGTFKARYRVPLRSGVHLASSFLPDFESE
jgi:hypothetical protein